MKGRHLLIGVCIVLAACGTKDDGNNDSAIASDTKQPSTDIPTTEDAQSGTPDISVSTSDGGARSSDTQTDTVESTFSQVTVLVTLDGELAFDTLVMQAGRPEIHDHTNFMGKVTLALDTSVIGDLVVSASHPEARQQGVQIFAEFPEPEYTIALRRFDKTDNPDYEFQPAGEPGNSPNTEYCGHCHESLVEDWYDSVHQKSAKNNAVQDLYAGTASQYSNQELCISAGGKWLEGIIPGTTDTGFKCYLGDGVLPVLNPGCDSTGTCDGKGTQFGGCADCHAPSINGKLGGRDLHEATGWAYDWGVQCESCHRVESINMEAEPGVAGRLVVVRPSEPSPSPALGEFAPLFFGPTHDNLNARMGSVQRDFFHEAELCAGCHEQEQAVLVPGQSIDKQRWPSGKLPIHSTYSEWKDGPMNPAAPCQSCHMPPNPQVTNSADQQVFTMAPVGIVAGWFRPPGQVNHHTWDGPRAVNSGMLQSAAALFVNKSVKDNVLTVTVRTKNSGPGHAIPTGEPLRSMILLVTAHCNDSPLVANGGDVVPSFGGYLMRQTKDQNWSQWSNAKPGQWVTVVKRSGDYYDYTGFGPFGDGTFSPKQKGMPVETYVGQSKIKSVDDSGVTFESALPDGDVAYLSGSEEPGFAGQPGFGFARVLTDAKGREMVPHFLAVDVRSDNRLLPQQSTESTHTFETTCDTPTVKAQLYHRAYPLDLARERGWDVGDTLMVEVIR